ncbi:MAG: hypothetical protein AAGK00_19130 [Pseudomonadota bacterium]
MTVPFDTHGLEFGPYMSLADPELRIFSIFDDLKYDRADADMMSPGMRRHAIDKLAKLGFKQTAGTVLSHKDTGVRCLIPKFHALGASPFDITRYTKRGPHDFYILTPTQTACQFIDNYRIDEAAGRIKELMRIQPINLFRLVDYLERKPDHENFMMVIGHLKYTQRVAVESEPLRRRRALG